MSTTELKGTIILATDTSAKVGIGKTPLYRLDVAAASRITGLIVNGSMDNAQDATYQELTIGEAYSTNKSLLIRCMPNTT